MPSSTKEILEARQNREKHEHKVIFMKTIYEACGDMGMAIAEYDGSEEDFDEEGDYSNPVGDAESNMSYWEE